MKYFYLSFLVFTSSLLFSQKIEKLFEEEKFKEIVALEKQSATFTGKELYRLGFAFFREENDDKAIEYYDQALKKGYNHPNVFFIEVFPRCI